MTFRKLIISFLFYVYFIINIYLIKIGRLKVKTEKEKLAKAKQYRHMTFYEAADMAARAKVKEMWLTHFSPSLVGPERYMKDVKKIFPDAHLGKDGKTVELDFQED